MVSSMFQHERHAPRYLMMNNHLLHESCSSGGFREFDSIQGRHKSDYAKRTQAQPPVDSQANACFDFTLKNQQAIADELEELKMEKKSRLFESEGDVMSSGFEDFFQLQDKLNRSIRSKETKQCLSEQGICGKKCQHRHNHDHFSQHIRHIMHDNPEAVPSACHKECRHNRRFSSINAASRLNALAVDLSGG